ncbi:MAG: hypothetical protein AAFY60_12445 [Myxococcota bacterium]
MAQMLRALNDPAYAERLKDVEFQSGEQRRMLTQVGGLAVPVGRSGGRGAECHSLVNAAVASVGLRFQRTFATARPSSMRQAEWSQTILERTLSSVLNRRPVPLAFGPNPATSEHFVLAVEARRRGVHDELRIYNPADGSLYWVSLGWLAHPSYGFTPTQTCLTVAYLPELAPGEGAQRSAHLGR